MTGDAISVRVLLPGVLADLAGGEKAFERAVAAADLGGLLDVLAGEFPVLDRRLRDDTGALRRYVNVYVDGRDVRAEEGLRTELRDASVVQILPSVAGG